MALLLPLLAFASIALADPAAEPLPWPAPIAGPMGPLFRKDNLSGAGNASTSTACADVHMIVARGSNEPDGMGVLGSLAYKVAAALPSTSTEWVDYPAVLLPYDQSSTKGYQVAMASVMSYVDSCKRGKIVMMGYSQGAQVVGDVMCGAGGALGIGPYGPALNQSYAQNVVAVVMMGDPRHMNGTAWDAGTADSDGIFPRTETVSCASVSSKLKSYCDMGDPFCARGLDMSVHTSYCDRYNDDAFNFITQKLKEANAVTQNSDGTFTTHQQPATTTVSAKPSSTSSNEGGRQAVGAGAPLALAVILLFAALM